MTWASEHRSPPGLMPISLGWFWAPGAARDVLKDPPATRHLNHPPSEGAWA